ncbi:ribosome biogenesis GTP-binding protein YlqF [Methyloversatilis sp. RAC08]|mgnify:CR=1 FL=1|uniref:ribosome biogenesis GTPase YlqF n=1 Tax=Methyloversatilis sp. RAC08 TaxID=1842540 RepID=UPI00083E52EC|nr:ribosome biogenesis GTPase YlqF [Methyloversatilis sp. RAC08]AOF81034.1 ribosome biogenesis GTP-binding protein YlqF [Methyloversatilis sp. RAC08]
MSIQWFPGHMTAARKHATDAMKSVDVVVEVLDARLPDASSNPLIHAIRTHRNRPCLKLLNKADLADPEATAAWLKHFNAQPNTKAVSISARKPGDAKRIEQLAQSLAPHRDDNLKPLRLIIMGIPNVGKSTLMNALVKKHVAATGDEPAITKSIQRIHLTPRLTLYDTPGLMWPKIEHESDGLMLAASHAIGRNAIIDEEVATFLGNLLQAKYPALMTARYGCTPDMDGVSVIQHIAARRGYRIKGGAPDYEKASFTLLQDYRDGAIGRVSLETPESRAKMLAADRAAKAEKARQKAPDDDTTTAD